MANGKGWASDEDAGDLLAGILDETEQAASVEQGRLEAELAQREAEQRRAHEAEEAERRARAEAKLSAEAERQASMRERRTARIEAIRVEELKASGQWVEPVDEAREELEQAVQEVAREGAPVSIAQASAPAPAPVQQLEPRGAGRGRVIVGMLSMAAAALVTVGVAAALGVGSYTVDNQTYLKVAASPIDTDTRVRAAATIPLSALAQPEAKTEAAKPRVKRPRGGKRTRPGRSGGSSSKGLKLDLVGKGGSIFDGI